MILMIALGWYGLGLLGCALLWFERTCWFRGREGLSFMCPTPKVITMSLIFSVFGVPLLIAGAVIVAISDDIGRDGWWNTPICKRNAVD